MQRSLVEKPDSLSIRIRPGGFSLFVYGENNHVISQRTLNTDLLQANTAGILDRQAEINRPYKKTAIICETEYYTVVPDLFSEPGSYRTLLQLHYPAIDEQYGIFYERIQKAILIYALPRVFVQNMQARLPDAGFYTHLMFPLKKASETSGDFMLVYLREKKVDICWFSRKNLQYYNSFDYETQEDVAYHCLHLIEQLELDTMRTKIQFIGDETQVRPDLLLQAYLAQVTFIPHTVEYENYQW